MFGVARLVSSVLRSQIKTKLRLRAINFTVTKFDRIFIDRREKQIGLVRDLFEKV